MNNILTAFRSLFLLGTLAFLTLSACSRNTEFGDRGSKGGDKTVVAFKLIDGTYAISDSEEDAVSEVHILLFNPKNELINVTPIVGVFTQTGRKVEVKVELTTLAYGNIVLLANARAILSNVTLTKNMSYDDAMNLMQLNLPGKWNADSGSGGYVNIPMYGETGYVTVSATNNIFNTTLLRMLYRVDVNIVDAALTDFELTSVHVYNRETLGMLRPSKVAGKPSMPSMPAKAVASLIYEGGEITTPNISCKGEIFLMESLIASELDDKVRLENALCLVVGGKYIPDGTTYYYRVDFAMNDTGADAPYPKHFYNPLRNHHYKINIQAVLGAGEKDPNEALKREITLIKANVLDWGNGGGIDGDIDGKYVLRLSQGGFTLPYLEHTASSTDNKLTVSSTHPDGWFVEKITGADGSTSPPPDSWLSIDLPSSGTPQMTEKTFSLILKENTALVARVGYIFIKSGSRMVYKVKVTQQGAPIRIAHIVWNDYDGVKGVATNDDGSNDTDLTSITVTQSDGNVKTSTISGGNVDPIIELYSPIASIVVTYKGYALTLPADKYTHDDLTNTLTVTDRSLIGKAIHLDRVRNDLTGSYIQVSDVDLTSYTNWVPIGANTSFTEQFKGSYDGGSGNSGKGFKISNLQIDRGATNYIGLFGYASATSVLTKIHIAAGSSIKGGGFVGSICGESRGSISNSSNEATVTTTVTGNSYIGGIVGQGTTITSCTNNAVIKGDGNIIGGICGYQLATPATSIISNCHNLAGGIITTGPASQNVGGVVGYSAGTISACSNNSPIIGLKYIGGICGSSQGGVIADCNNTAAVEATATSDSIVGGIAGYGGTIKDCNNSASVKGAGSMVGGICGWQQGTADVGVCTNTGSVTGKNCVGGFFGRSSATISDARNTSTGTVTGVNQVGNICGENYSSGTISGITNNTPITSEGNDIGGIVGKNYGSVRNCTNTASVSGTGTGAPTFSDNIGGIVGFSAQVESVVASCHNTATISGTGHSVGGICGWHAGTGNVGVCTNSGNINGGKDYTGGLFGYNFATIDAAGNTSTGIVSGLLEVGNICGVNKGTISGITNNTPITSEGNHIGGIAGNNAGKIDNCINNASVSGTGGSSVYVGGIVGLSHGGSTSFINCHNTELGVITGVNFVGGIVGDNASPMQNCTNKGVISGKNSIGGIIGNLVSGTIINSHNEGGVNGEIAAGGVVGYNQNDNDKGKIERCTNTASVLATTEKAGGICGENRGTISGCVNKGNVRGGKKHLGGIVGSNPMTNSKVSTSYNIGSVTGDAGATNLGAIVGYSIIDPVNCYFGGAADGMAQKPDSYVQFSSTAWPTANVGGWDDAIWDIGGWGPPLVYPTLK